MAEADAEILSFLNSDTQILKLNILESIASVFDIWSALFYILIAFIITMTLKSYLNSRNLNQIKLNHNPIAFNLMRALFSQNIHLTGTFTSRYLFLNHLILCMFLRFIFFGVFTTNNFVEVVPFRIQTLDDIPKSNLRPYFMKGQSITTRFKTGWNDQFKRIWTYAQSMGIEDSMIELSRDQIHDFVHNKLMNGMTISYSVMTQSLKIAACNHYGRTSYVSKQKFGKRHYAIMSNKNISKSLFAETNKRYCLVKSI